MLIIKINNSLMALNLNVFQLDYTVYTALHFQGEKYNDYKYSNRKNKKMGGFVFFFFFFTDDFTDI